MHKLSQWSLIERTGCDLVRISLSMCLLLIMAGCAGAGNSSMNKSLVARVLISSANCGMIQEGASVSIIASDEGFDKGNPKLAGLTKKALGENFNTIFERELVMQISMGRQSTGGFALRLMQDELVVEDGWVNIKVQWVTPAKGMMLTQALTSPCLLVAIPKQEYEGIRIIDQIGKIRLQMSL